MARGLLCILLFPTLAFAQLRVSVRDKAGEPVLDLPQSQFHVLVDGKEQPISSFAARKTPLSIGLMIDDSAPTRHYQAQFTGINSIAGDLDPQDEMFVIDFDQTIYMYQDFTHDATKLEKALQRNWTPGWSKMRDPLSYAIDHALKLGKNPTKILILISASDDDSSTIKQSELVEKARASGVAIYAIGLLNDADRDEKRRAQHALKELAEASGGAEYEPRAAEKLDTVIANFIDPIRNQYLIGYAPVSGHARVIVDFPGLTVRVASSQ